MPKASAPLATQYFDLQTIEFDVVNISGETLFIEAASLKFEEDTGATPNYVDCFLGLRLLPNGTGRITSEVRPIPLYRESTNQFSVLLKFRPEVYGRLGKQATEMHPGFYIIINTPPATLGDVFISFKQPEDRRLANILERYAKRAGFTPRLFMRNPALGADQWKSIQKLIKNAHSIFVVWGRRTEWGDGVEKEILLCRKHHLKEILLIEDGLALPGLYQNTQYTYQRYDPADPARALSDAVGSLRDQVVALL